MKIESRYLELGSQFVRTMFVVAYPRYIRVGWFAPVINLNVPLDISMYFYPVGVEVILKQLAGRVHQVYTGVALLPSRGEPVERRIVCTEVKFTEMTARDIEFYVETGEWSGVTGAYRIQERGAFFVEWIRGSYSNVVGLPLATFYGMLKANHWTL